VSFAEGAAFAQKYNIKFFETSAKTAQNVEESLKIACAKRTWSRREEEGV
jgi:hypothetical protein